MQAKELDLGIEAEREGGAAWKKKKKSKSNYGTINAFGNTWASDSLANLKEFQCQLLTC